MQLIVIYFYWNKSCSLLKKQKQTKTNKRHICWEKLMIKKPFNLIFIVYLFLKIFLVASKDRIK